MTKTMYKGKMVGVIDCTPTWEAVLPSLLAVITDGNAEGQKIAKQELRRMAQAADRFNELGKEYVTAMKVVNNVDTSLATLFIGSDHGITPQAFKACQESANDIRMLLYKQKDEPVIFTLTAEDGTEVPNVATENDIIDFTNTSFEYDRRDADADEITDLYTAITELRKAGFKVKVN